MWNKTKVTEKQILYTNSITGEETSVDLVYKHSELGNFYIFPSIFSLPYTRKMVFDLIQQNERLGIEKKELIEYIERIKKLCQEGKTMDIYAIASYMESKAKEHWDYKRSSLAIVALLIVQEDENISAFNQGEIEEKINRFSQDPTMLDFFLQYAQLRVESLMKLQESSSKIYSQAQMNSMEALPH